MELIKKDRDSALYQAETIYALSDKSIAALPWPAGISRLKFIFNHPILNEYEVLHKNFSPKYTPQILYSVHKKDLIKPAIKKITPSITLESPENFEKLKYLYKKTDIEYFYNQWREYLTPQYLREIDSFISQDLSLSGSAWLLKQADYVGLINVVKWKDYLGEPVDWISWVWIDRRLSNPERKCAHFQLICWLENKIIDRVQCVVHSFNIPSQRFFRKIGFKPVCIYVAKKA